MSAVHLVKPIAAALIVGACWAAPAVAADEAGPDVVLSAPADATTTSETTIAVAGSATDPSGVAEVRVQGFLAVLTGGAFSVEVPLAVGANTIAVQAVDTIGNRTDVVRTVIRSDAAYDPAPSKPRARGLAVVRIGKPTYVRFTLDEGASRVAVRLWRRVLHPAAQPTYTPVTSLRFVSATPGRRHARLLPGRIPAGVYQVRVSVVSQGGVAITTLRHTSPRTPPGR